jgi:3-oxoacyl-[acyl-carrier protein] reductase
MLDTLTGYSVVVTGGTKGIGKGIARSFVEAGARVLITGRDERSAQAAVGDLAGYGPGPVSFVLGDVVVAADMRRTTRRDRRAVCECGRLPGRST